MHRCLLVPELLVSIVEVLQAEEGGAATVAALARTAKCFQEATLDALWATQDTLVPLVKCFPPELLTEAREEDGTRILSFTRDPEPDEWTTVKSYAARIRVVRLDILPEALDYGTTELAESVYVTLRRCVGQDPLLPNLRSFEWGGMPGEPNADVTSLLLLLSSPTVSDMDIVLEGVSQDAAQRVAEALREFGRESTQLRNIGIICKPSCLPIEHVVLQIGLSHDHLQELSYNWEEDMPAQTLERLASLNNLRRVSIRANRETSGEVLRWAQGRIGGFFPSLQFLTLHTDGIDVCHQWLSTMPHQTLNSLTFHVNEPPTSIKLRELFTQLVAHPSHGSLRKLRFFCSTPCLRDQTMQHALGPDMIAPLFQLDLEVLKLEPGAPINIDDDFVARMARAWPHLHMLELNANWRRYGVPQVTLMGLTPLAEHCPGITALAIPFNTQVLAFDEAYEAGNRPTGGVSFERCFMFGVGASPIDRGADHVLIAGFLSDLCPHLMSLQTAWTRAGAKKDDEDVDVENMEMGEMWKETERYAREMARVRRQERMWMQQY